MSVPAGCECRGCSRRRSLSHAISRAPLSPKPINTNPDLAIGYRAGQDDSWACGALVEIVKLDALCEGSGDYEDFHNLNKAIKAAGAELMKRGML